MDVVTAATMERLVAEHDGPCVSMYLPAQRSGREVLQGRIRLGNLLGEARGELVAAGMRRPDADRLLAGAGRLADDASFWQHQEDGLAVFVSGDGITTLRMPIVFPELVVVADAFHVKPLWPAVAGEVFHVLALSRNEVRLYWADEVRIGDVDLPEDVPESLAEALWFDDPEKQLQHRGAARVGRGRVVAAFHGHGVPDERGDARLERFLRAVDRGVSGLLDPGSPLLLAGVDDLTAVFRRVSRHRGIVADTLHGNPETTPAGDLHRGALSIMKPLRERVLDDDAAGFLAAGGLAVSGVPDAVAAALAGRVATLFLPLGVQEWGRVVEDGRDVVIHAERATGDRDLLDVAGSAAWSAGGRVHAVAPERVPGDGPVAAHLRF